MSDEKAKRNIYAELSAPLPAEAKQIALSKDTHKGYDTAGQNYQYHVDRFNMVLGITGWKWDWKVFAEDVEKYSSGKPKYIYMIDVSITIKANTDLELLEDTKRCIGGHDAISRADALKGAITNAFKKTASFYGVGREAYAGELDDDFKPNPDRDDDKKGGNGNGNGKNPQPPTPPQPPKDSKKPEPTPIIQNSSISPDNLKKILEAKNIIGAITFDKVLTGFGFKNASEIPDDKTAEKIKKEIRNVYDKAVAS